MSETLKYVPAYKGYIADVPLVWFKRCDGRVFYFDEITQATVNTSADWAPINAGWSLYPVAYVPSGGSMEVQMSSGQFNADLFAMANAANFSNSLRYNEPFSETLTFGATRIAYLSKPATSITRSSISMTNMKLVSEPDGELKSNEFTADIVSVNGVQKYRITVAQSNSAQYTGVLGAGKLGVMHLGRKYKDDEIEIHYSYDLGSSKQGGITISNRKSAVGELVLKWPVYAAGNDCTESAIKGYVCVHVLRCRVTQMPGFDTNYKSAAVNSVTWSAMDPKKERETKYTIAYIDAK